MAQLTSPLYDFSFVKPQNSTSDGNIKTDEISVNANENGSLIEIEVR